MASVTLRRAAQRVTALKPFTLSLCRSITSGSTRLESKIPLYEAATIRIPPSQRSSLWFNNGLQARARDRNLTGTISFWNDQIKWGTRPNGLSYLILLDLYAEFRLFKESVRVFEDMVAMGMKDKLKPLNLVLLSAIEDTTHIFEALALFPQHGVTPDTTTYQYHLLHLDRMDNLERAMQLLEEMHTNDVKLNKECMRIVILMAARLNMPTLAMELAVNSEGMVGKIDDAANMAILMSAAASMNAKTTQWAWDLVPPNTTLTEPLCIDILNLAGRHGLPDLANSVLSYLTRERITIQEHHLAPLIGAHCVSPKKKKENLREAFLALNKFREYEVEILPESAEALVSVIGKSTTTLDEAYDILLELPRPVNIDAVNATLQAAAVTLSDLPRAVGIYKELSTLECTPTTQTFDILLAGCLKASHRALGERLFSDLISLGLKPSVQTYTRLILLALTETEYENAFERLEEMKQRMMTPPLIVYDALVRRLVTEKDSRADLALEDMEHCGYKVSPSLRDFLLGKEGEGAGRKGNWRRQNGGPNGGNGKRQANTGSTGVAS